MASAPLFAALAMRTLDRREPARPRRSRFRWLAVRRDPKAPRRATEEVSTDTTGDSEAATSWPEPHAPARGLASPGHAEAIRGGPHRQLRATS